MVKYDVTAEMEFPDDLHGEDVMYIAEQRLGMKVKKITERKSVR